MKQEFVSFNQQIQAQKDIIYETNVRLQNKYGSKIKNTSNENATDFDDIDEDIETPNEPLEMEDIYQKIQAFLKSKQSLSDANKHGQEFDLKQKIYNQRVIKEKRDESIKSLNQISQHISNLTIGSTTSAGSESSGHESSREENSGIHQLQQTLDQMQSKMKHLSEQNEKIIEEENINLNSSLSNISREIDFKSMSNLDVKDNQNNIRKQTEVFAEIAEKLRMQIDQINTQNQSSQKVTNNVPMAIMVQEGTQTEIKIDEKEIQTIEIRQHDKIIQVQNESRDQQNQTSKFKSTEGQSQTQEFFGVLLNPVHMCTQASISDSLEQSDKTCQTVELRKQNVQTNISSIEIAPIKGELQSDISQIVDQVYSDNKKQIEKTVTESKVKPAPSVPFKSQIIKVQTSSRQVQTTADLSQLDNKLEQRQKLQQIETKQKELQKKEQEIMMKQGELKQIENRNMKQNQDLSVLSQTIKEKQTILINKVKELNNQKLQIEQQRMHNIDLKKFLYQKEEDQNFIETELEKEREQLEDEYKELLSKMEFVKQNEVIIENDHKKVQQAKEKLKIERNQLFVKEKEFLLKQKAFSDEQNRQKTYMFELKMQDQHISKLEKCLDLFFDQLQPVIDGEMGDDEEESNTLFEKERDDIMVKRYQLEEFKKELGEMQERIAQIKAVQHNDIALSEKTVLSENSDDERLTYMRHREAKSACAINRKIDQLEMVDLKLYKQIEMEQQRKNERKLQANVQPILLPRFSARQSSNLPRQSLAARLSVARGSFIQQQRPSERVSAALSQRQSNRRSTLWPKPTMPQIDDVPESLEDEVFKNLSSNALVQEVPDYQNDENEEDQDFYIERKTDQVSKEISFNVLTQNQQISQNQDSSDGDSSNSSSQEQVKQPQLESPLNSPNGGRQSVKENQEEKYNWFAAASKPEDIPPGIEMSVTPSKDESLREMRETNLLGSPNLVGTDTPEVSPSPNQMVRETTERISDIGQNMKNLFGGMHEPQSLRESKAESEASQLSFANEKSFAAAPQYEHKKIDKFNKNFSQQTKIDIEKVKEEVKEVFIESAEEESNRSNNDEEDEIQNIINSSVNIDQKEMLASSPDKSGYEEEPVRVAEPSKQKHISRINRAHLNKSSFAPMSDPMTEADISKMELLGDILNQQDDMASVSVMLAESFDDDETGQRDSMTSSMTVFTPQQLQDFERIGLSGELFKEVRMYYKQQGKTKEQMMEDLMAYQKNLEMEIQSNVQLEKEKKDKKEKKSKKDKSDKRDKSAKKDKKKKDKESRKSRKSGSRKSDTSPSKSKSSTSKSRRQRSSKKIKDYGTGVYDYEGPLRDTQQNQERMSPFGASNLQNLISEPIKQPSSQKQKQNVKLPNPKFSQRSLNFDQDSLEESVFIEQFKIQDRGDETMKRTLRDGEVSMVNTTQMDNTQIRDSSMSFAGDEQSINVVEVDEIVKPQRNKNLYKESLINQISSQNNDKNVFGGQKNLYKESIINQIESYDQNQNMFNQKPTQMQGNLFAISEEPNQNESIQYDENFRQTEAFQGKNQIGERKNEQYDENFRQTEAFEGKNQIGEQVRDSFRYPQNNNLPDVFKQKQVPDQPRKSRDFFNNLKNQRASKKSRPSKKSDFDENFRETERKSTNSRQEGINTGIINYEEVKPATSPENRHSFNQSFETNAAKAGDPNNSVINFGNLIQNFQK